MLILNRQKIVTAQASTAYKHSLKEVLASPAIASQIKAPARSPCAPAPRGLRRGPAAPCMAYTLACTGQCGWSTASCHYVQVPAMLRVLCGTWP